MSTGGISLEQYFKKKNSLQFPNFKSGFAWSSYNLKDLSINMFEDFRSAQILSNIKAYIGAPQYTDEDIQAYLDKAIQGVYYINNDNNDKYDEATERKFADIRLFISPDGAFLLKAHQALKNNIKKDEIAVFLEIPDGDIVSGNVMLVATGEHAKKYAEEVLRHKWTQDQYSLDESQIIKLISTLSSGQDFVSQLIAIATELKHSFQDLKSQVIIDISSTLAGFFGETLRIDEKIWNIEHPDYLLENDVIEILQEKYQQVNNFFDSIGLDGEYRKVLNALLEKGIRKIENTEISLQDSWALRCGLWNGLMDLLSGLFDLIALVNKGIKAHRHYKQNEDYYKALLLEYADNFLQAALQIDWSEVLSHGAEQYRVFKEYVSERLSLEYWQELLNFNHTEIAYYKGYLIFNILEAVIPPIKLAKLAKAGKLEKVIRMLDDLASSASKTGAPAVKASDEVVGAFFKTIEHGIDAMKGGDKTVNKFIDNIFDALKKQVDEVVDKASPDDLKRIANKKRLQQHEDFIKKWKGKSIKALTKTEIADALKGFTEQGNKIAKLIEEGKINIRILEDYNFNKMCQEVFGDTLEVAMETHAFADGTKMFFRASRKPDVFLSELIHEGTHAKEMNEIIEMFKSGKTEDEISKIIGSNWSSEKRAFFHERAWQEATGMKKDFETIEKMLDNIFSNYDEY